MLWLLVRGAAEGAIGLSRKALEEVKTAETPCALYSCVHDDGTLMLVATGGPEGDVVYEDGAAQIGGKDYTFIIVDRFTPPIVALEPANER